MDPIDLNADLGEGFGRWTLTDDDALLSVVTSANVACGFHAGDPSTMRRVCERAAEAGVRIGAQVSYRDLAGFGRRSMDVPPDELADEVTYQIGALAALRAAAGRPGALREAARRALQPGRGRRGAGRGRRRGGRSGPAAASRSWACPDPPCCARAAEAGLPAVTEAFADRAYEPDGTLVSRASHRCGAGRRGGDRRPGRPPGARPARSWPWTATVVAVRPRSLCLHGDTPGAAALAVAVRRALTEAGAAIAPFA